VTNNASARLIQGAGGATGVDGHTGSGNGLDFIAGRVSYALGLQGPSMVLATACSSSLVAIHLACQALRQDEADLAVAGGVNLILAPDTCVLMTKMRALAPDGTCKTFDASADGYGRGEGCGMVALKRLSDAQAAGDPVLAVIRGSAVNHNGPASGLTVPHGPSQEALVRHAWASAGVGSADVSFIEAHGTGTPLGDPIELRALSAVLGKREQPCWIGSVKTNIGHLESAAGVAGLIKVVLALKHGAIPPNLHFREPNPRFPWSEAPLAVPTRLVPWSAPRSPP
jgi:acyl transferase domain-containing protein